jgi:cold shock protein
MRFDEPKELHRADAFSKNPVEATAGEMVQPMVVTVVFMVTRGRMYMALGTVKWFNDAKGYGFISRNSDNKDVFVHYSSISGDGFRTLNQGQSVEYEESDGPKGLHAVKVVPQEAIAT